VNDYACSVGKYCPEGTTTEINCPQGTYNPITGGKSEDDCIATPAGFWTGEGAFEYNNGSPGSYTTGCPPGYFCLEGTQEDDKYANPCMPGYYRGTQCAEKASECAFCPSGFYCPDEGVHTPTSCPPG
jgi:hypothetical protein